MYTGIGRWKVPTQNIVSSVSKNGTYSIKNGTTCVTKTLENGWPATVQPPPPWLYLAITWPKIIPQKMLSNRNTRHKRTRHLAARRHCPTDLPFHGFPPALLTIYYIMNRQQGSRSGWGGWHTQQSSSSMLLPDQGGLVRWWGGGVDLHVGIDIPSHQISRKKSSNFSLGGGESYVTINNGGLSTASIFLPSYSLGGKCNTQHHVI